MKSTQFVVNTRQERKNNTQNIVYLQLLYEGMKDQLKILGVFAPSSNDEFGST